MFLWNFNRLTVYAVHAVEVLEGIIFNFATFSIDTPHIFVVAFLDLSHIQKINKSDLVLPEISLLTLWVKVEEFTCLITIQITLQLHNISIDYKMDENTLVSKHNVSKKCTVRTFKVDLVHHQFLSTYLISNVMYPCSDMTIVATAIQ